MNQSKHIKQEIPLEKLHDFQLKIVGDKVSSQQFISINGLKVGTAAGDENLGHGIGTIELILEPTKKPSLSITYHKGFIKKEVADCLGLEKVYR